MARIKDSKRAYVTATNPRTKKSKGITVSMTASELIRLLTKLERGKAHIVETRQVQAA